MLTRLIAALAIAGLVLGPQELGTGSVSGTVKDPGGGVIPGVTVQLVAGAEQRAAVTDSTGRYSIKNIPGGRYHASARTNGSLTSRTVLEVSAHKDVAWNVVLERYTGRSKERSTGRDFTNADLARGVYEAVLRHVYRSAVPARPRIGIISLIPPPFDDEDWPRELATVPAAVREAARANQRPVTIRQESLPAGARLISTMNEPSIPYTSISRVFATDDGLGALVVLEHYCGNLCGELTALWLERKDTASAWLVKALHGFWVA